MEKLSSEAFELIKNFGDENKLPAVSAFLIAGLAGPAGIGAREAGRDAR